MQENIDRELLNGQFDPVFFRLSSSTDKGSFQKLLADHPSLQIRDEIESQLRELLKSLSPDRKILPGEYPALITAHLGSTDIREYGVWVYYPWLNMIVHLLDEEEFVEVRTNRNRYKITREEQELLRNKKIGIIGLSVGQSIALTLAMERTCGELRLADFDTAELSNLNRIRTGVQNLGLMKTIIAAREIKELDPFIKVKIFNEGLTKTNTEAFFTEGGRLDLLVEVCDGLDIKILSRYKARELQIPVVMDTNDRGMLDVERFDLEPDREILHGLAGDLDPEMLQSLTNEDKIPYILQMVGVYDLSKRLKASMIEVEQSINTWPQLASSVTLGGAITTDVCRRIFLGQYTDSGRYYVDIDGIVKDKVPAAGPEINYDGPEKLSAEEMTGIAAKVSASTGVTLSEEQARVMVEAGMHAPSGGNCQPWHFMYSNGNMLVFHDLHYSYSLLDYDSLGSYLAIGAVVENISVKAAEAGLGTKVKYFPVTGDKKLVASISFYEDNAARTDSNTQLAKAINMRVTNRNLSEREVLPQETYDQLRRSISGYAGAHLHIVDDALKMNELGDIMATTEMMRLIHPRGHYDTFKKELRWTETEVNETLDGLDVRTLGAKPSEILALRVADDAEAIDFLLSVKGGKAFKKSVQKSVASASALCILTMPEYSHEDFIDGGRAIEHLWLTANGMGIAFQPISQFVFFMARLVQGGGEGLDKYFSTEFEKLRNNFYTLLPELKTVQPVFIFRLSTAKEPEIRSLRRSIDSAFIYL